MLGAEGDLAPRVTPGPELLEAEWLQRLGVEMAAGVQVRDADLQVVDDHPALGHVINVPANPGG
jgi:hypothetical protein